MIFFCISYLNSGLREARFVRQFFSRFQIGVMTLFKLFFQIFQLFLWKSGPAPSELRPLFVWIVRLDLLVMTLQIGLRGRIFRAETVLSCGCDRQKGRQACRCVWEGPMRASEAGGRGLMIKSAKGSSKFLARSLSGSVSQNSIDTRHAWSRIIITHA